jgi:hypothetical protein
LKSDNDEMSFQIMAIKNKTQINKIVKYFADRGIPTRIKAYTFSDYEYALYTDREHFSRALCIYEDGCQLVNVLNGKTVRRAKWL